MNDQARKSRGIGAVRVFPIIALWLFCGCQSPEVFDGLHGRPLVYPHDLTGEPTVLAFLNANDRRCDKEILPLVSLHHRQGTPVRVVASLIYDDYNFVREMKTIEQAVFPVFLDPKRRLANRFRVRNFPTYVFLDPAGDVVERTRDIGKVRDWVDSPEYHEKAYDVPPGSLQRQRDFEVRSRYGSAQPAASRSSGTYSGGGAI